MALRDADARNFLESVIAAAAMPGAPSQDANRAPGQVTVPSLKGKVFGAMMQEADAASKPKPQAAAGPEPPSDRQPHQNTEQETSNRNRDGAEDAGKGKAPEAKADAEHSPEKKAA